MNHISEGIAKAVEEDRVNPPPPPADVLMMEVEGYERAIREKDKPGSKKAGDDTSIMWMEAMTRRDLYRSATGKGLDDLIDVSRVEKTALSKLFSALHGDEWNRKFGWVGMLKSQTRPEIPPMEACASLYHGVETTKFMSNSLVGGLKLSGLGMYGELPKQIGDFETMKNLDMRWNLISGSLPRDLGALESLETLNFSGNLLGGELDAEVFRSLPNLKFLDLSSNKFHGNIPDAFAGMSTLRHLDLSSNMLEGAIPRSLSKCVRLEVLKLFDNLLWGELPVVVFSTLVKLKDLNVSRNKFSGNALSSLAVGCASLERLQLAENDFSGHLTPQALLGLPKLKILYLHKNRMGGVIPEEICTLTSLRRLNLSSNFFRGKLPANFGNLSSLESLLVGDNEIIGPLPRSFSALTNLRDFTVIKNYPSEHMSLSRAFRREDFHRLFVDGPAMGLDSAVWEHSDLYGDAPETTERFELFERRLYKQRGLPWGLGKIPDAGSESEG